MEGSVEEELGVREDRERNHVDGSAIRWAVGAGWGAGCEEGGQSGLGSAFACLRDLWGQGRRSGLVWAGVEIWKCGEIDSMLKG